MPCLRHSSAVGTPASASFKMAMICSSVNRFFFIVAPHSARLQRPFLHGYVIAFGGQVTGAGSVQATREAPRVTMRRNFTMPTYAISYTIGQEEPAQFDLEVE